MVKKLKLYLETTIPNYLLAEDVPREKEITEIFFQEIEHGQHDVFISTAVRDEIERTSDAEKKKKLLATLEDIPLLEVTESDRVLANMYVSLGIIPRRYWPDALHIAIATHNEMDVLVTWNMEHLANPETRIKVREENEKRKLKVIDLATPEEVMLSGRSII